LSPVCELTAAARRTRVDRAVFEKSES
jgi:hypothetical protein